MGFTDDGLKEYAQTLAEAGFSIYESTTPGNFEYFVYSQTVDGQECFGTVSREDIRLQGYSHQMPIKPSRENGSSMFLESVPDGWECLTVEAAQKVAQPTNSNHIVGTQANYWDPADLSRRFRKW